MAHPFTTSVPSPALPAVQIDLSLLKTVGGVLEGATGIQYCPGWQTLLVWRHMA